MKRFQFVLALVLVGMCSIAAAQLYYDPDQPGHGLTVFSVGDGYVAQWYAHDGHQTRWFSSDVCDYGEPCLAITVESRGFPAKNARQIEAGEIMLLDNRGRLILIYDLHIEQVGCWTLPGPLPPQCRDSNGNPDTSKIFRRGFNAAGEIDLERLVD